MDLTSYYRIVEQALTILGADPENARAAEEGQWDLSFGGISIMIDIYQSQGHGYVQCLGTVMKLPETNREKILEEVLELNHSMISAAFTKYKDNLYIKFARETDDLSVEEAVKIIKRIAIYSSNFANDLKNKYLAKDNNFNPQDQNTPEDVLSLLYSALDKKDFQTIKNICVSPDEAGGYIKQLIFLEKTQPTETDRITNTLKNMKVFSDYSFFDYQKKKYAQMKVQIDGKIHNLIFVKKDKNWLLYQTVENK